MTSAITREDVESVLWQSGIRSPDKIKRILRTIDLYAFTLARKYVPSPEQPRDPYYYLMPGESDKGIKVTRCIKCTEVKNWSLFSADSRRDTGHGITCKLCRKPKPKTVRPDGYEMKCRTCGEVKIAEGNFEKRSDSKSGYKLTCFSCEKNQFCPSCGRKRPKGSFTAESPSCIVCLSRVIEENSIPEKESA